MLEEVYMLRRWQNPFIRAAEMPSGNHLRYLFNSRPVARARLEGGSSYPNVRGTVYFYELEGNVYVYMEVFGLPHRNNVCSSGMFPCHIHSGDSCNQIALDPFAGAGSHYNPHGCATYNAGDLPVLIESSGLAFSIFLTDRFTVNEVVGRVIIIHRPEDFLPFEGEVDSPEKIACGKIEWI
jgi:Cu-Zn family superoxide dismutase